MRLARVVGSGISASAGGVPGHGQVEYVGTDAGGGRAVGGTDTVEWMGSVAIPAGDLVWLDGSGGRLHVINVLPQPSEPPPKPKA